MANKDYNSMMEQLNRLTEQQEKAQNAFEAEQEKRNAKIQALKDKLASAEEERNNKLSQIIGTVFISQYGDKIDQIFAGQFTRGHMPTKKAVEEFIKQADFHLEKYAATEMEKKEETAIDVSKDDETIEEVISEEVPVEAAAQPAASYPVNSGNQGYGYQQDTYRQNGGYGVRDGWNGRSE